MHTDKRPFVIPPPFPAGRQHAYFLNERDSPFSFSSFPNIPTFHSVPFFLTCFPETLARRPNPFGQAFSFSPSELPAPRRIPDVPFYMPDRIPCAPVTLPHRDTSPDTGPHPCFVLFQREPPLFSRSQRAARRKMRVTKR